MIEPGRYRHFKGTFYHVLLMAFDSETRADVVVYKSETTHQVWVRSLESWNTPVEGGKPRFQKVPRIGSKHRHKTLNTLVEVSGFEDSCSGLNNMVLFKLLNGNEHIMPLEEWLENFTTVEG